MIEGYSFIMGSLIISLIPNSKKNFNKMCLFGVFLYSISMMTGGPIYFIKI